MPRSFRIALISPYSQVSAIGLRQISACLQAAGFDTMMIFLPDPGEWLSIPQPHPQSYPDSILDQVCNLCAGVDLVGIGVMTNFVRRARSLTRAIQDQLMVPVIWGGIHPTVKPAESLAWADFVCVGEGEEAVVELANRMSNDRPTLDIPNIWLTDDQGNVVANPLRPLNRSLDALPLPDYELSQQYVLHKGQVIPLTHTLLAHYMLSNFAGEPHVAYMTCMTRGCSGQCTYCCTNALTKMYPDWHKLRRRSPEHVISELEAARRLIPALQAVMFLDDTFLAASIEEIQNFGEMYRQEIGLPFYILCTPGSVTKTKVRLLVEAGLRDVEMGIQTGSQRTRTLFKRPGDDDKTLAAAQCLHRFQQWIPHPRYDVISDNPYETQADHLDTLRLLYRLPGDFLLYSFSLGFYPGTELYHRAKANGLIQNEEQDVHGKNIIHPQPTYYNFVLWCLHRHLPRWLLWLLIWPPLFRFFSTRAMTWPLRMLWTVINALRSKRALGLHHRQVARILRHPHPGERL